MKHKAPCSSRGYSGLRESGPLNIDGEGDDDVGEDDEGVGVDGGCCGMNMSDVLVRGLSHGAITTRLAKRG